MVGVPNLTVGLATPAPRNPVGDDREKSTWKEARRPVREAGAVRDHTSSSRLPAKSRRVGRFGLRGGCWKKEEQVVRNKKRISK